MEVADEDVDRELVRYGWKRRECIKWLSTHHIAAELILKIFGHVFANSRVDASETRVLTAVERRIDYLLCSSGTKSLQELARKAMWESTWIGIPFSITSDREEVPSPARRHLLEVQSKVQNLRIQCSEESVLHWAWSHQENELYSQAPKPWIDQVRGIVAKLVAGPNDPMTSLRAIHICMEVSKPKFSFSPEDRHCIVTSEIAAKRAVQVFLDALQLLPYQAWASLRPRDSREDDTTRTAIQSDTVTSLKVDELFETIRESEKEALTNIDGWCICMRTAPEDELFKGRLAH